MRRCCYPGASRVIFFVELITKRNHSGNIPPKIIILLIRWTIGLEKKQKAEEEMKITIMIIRTLHLEMPRNIITISKIIYKQTMH